MDEALSVSDNSAAARALVSAWSSFGDVGLRFVLANLYGDQLSQINWESPEMAGLAYEVALLSRTYQGVANRHWPTNFRQAFFDAIALGTVASTTYEGVIPDAIRTGFAKQPSLKYTNLLSRNADGEALLLAISSVAAGPDSFPSDISDAIAVFRVLGLSDTARQFSLQLMLSQS